MDNQTEELWVSSITPLDKGTGLFVFPQSYVSELAYHPGKRTSCLLFAAN